MRNSDQHDLVARAESYPYDVRDDAFTFRAGRADPFEPDLLAGRTAILAIGSNGAPLRLTTKFGGVDEIVPVMSARLANHAVVYAATITGYGSIPATFVPAAGATALVALTFLTDDQLARMHASEALGQHYELVDVTASVQPETPWAAMGTVLAYRNLFGPLHVNAQPLRLAEVPTVGTRFGAAYQSGLLTLLHHHFGRPDETYAGFITDLVANLPRRLAIRDAMGEGLMTRPRMRAGATQA
ncbi:MAG: hypothetical protein EA356_13315 [Geminicoccaceae bacterium]|nr:MAG: hypothetical protein EA356_13315 [Geminicoccaceae bacterium]